MKRLAIPALIMLACASSYATVLLAQAPARGDIVLIRDAQSRLSVKAIIAVPGDTVSVADGRIVVNGVASDISINAGNAWSPREVAAEYYFVAGDPLRTDPNPQSWGLIPADAILGTVNPRR